MHHLDKFLTKEEYSLTPLPRPKAIEESLFSPQSFLSPWLPAKENFLCFMQSSDEGSLGPTCGLKHLIWDFSFFKHHCDDPSVISLPT